MFEEAPEDPTSFPTSAFFLSKHQGGMILQILTHLGKPKSYPQKLTSFGAFSPRAAFVPITAYMGRSSNT